uniref:Ribosome assembly factor mrt4 n=1 Tax=Romanomermis culicivorax TaxID=13658 RepID=A0A915K8F5_ROMCU
MPKSKRDNQVSLTKVNKKGKASKLKIVDEIHKCVDSFKLLFVFSIDGMRNTNIKDLRVQFRDSRFFFGKNKVMSIALGRSPQDEYKNGLHNVSKHLNGQCALMFTNRTFVEIKKYLTTYKKVVFARSGNRAGRDVELDQGPLEYFPHSMEPSLRKLGLPVKLEKGVITLDQDYTVCNEKDILTPEQAKILKLFQIKLVQFKVKLLGWWSEDNGYKNLTKKKRCGVNDYHDGLITMPQPKIQHIPDDLSREE